MLTLTILLASALVLLMYGAFSNNTCTTNRLTSVAALLAAAPLVWQPTTGALFVTASGPLLLMTPASNLVWLALLALTPLVLALNPKGAHTQKPEYPVLILLSVTGMLLVSAAHDWLTFYVGLELMSFPMYIMCAFNRNESRSAESGLKYFVLGALASGLFLYGASLFYATTGSTNFTSAASIASSLGAQPLAAVSLALILVAVLFKLSAAPFHVWTPDVYQGAPTPTTAFLGSLPKLAMLAILLRILHLPFAGPELATLWQPALMAAAAISMVFGSAVAIIQTDLKRLLAYSTIGNVGFILVGVVAGTPAASAGVLFYAVVYLLNTIGLFAFLTALGKPNPSVDDIKGLVKTHPWLTGVLIVNLFSLAGVPPLAGFMGKLNVFLPAVAAGHTLLVLLAVGASVIALFYSLNLIRYAVFAEGQGSVAHKISPTLKLVLVLTTAATLLLGIFPQALLSLLQQSTAALF